MTTRRSLLLGLIGVAAGGALTKAKASPFDTMPKGEWCIAERTWTQRPSGLYYSEMRMTERRDWYKIEFYVDPDMPLEYATTPGGFKFFPLVKM